MNYMLQDDAMQNANAMQNQKSKIQNAMKLFIFPLYLYRDYRVRIISDHLAAYHNALT